MRLVRQSMGPPLYPVSGPADAADSNRLLFQISNLSLNYAGKPAFRNVSIDVRAGRITAVVGPSGCGKTSLLSCLNRLTDLIPNCLVKGSIRLHGDEILRPDLDLLALRRKVGMVFQRLNPFPLTIRKNLELPLKEHGTKNPRELKERVEQALTDVGIWEEVRDRLDTSALSLSGGQQQRLCIARALILKPEILLMDEPCSSLDPISSGVVEDLISDLRGRYSILLVTHNLAQARRLADDVAVFWADSNGGRLVEHGPKEQIFERPRQHLTALYVKGMRG